jgi:hypothetical protein
MVIPEFFIALIITFVLTGIYMLVTWGVGPRTGLIWLFLIIFLLTWAGGIWFKPFGPTLGGSYWLVFLLTGLVAVLLLIIVTPRKAPRGRRGTLHMLERIEKEKELENMTYITLSLFFWILLCILVLAIVLRYVIDVDIT